MLAIHLMTIGIFIALGILFSSGKGANLIAGYNTAPKAERDKYDQKALCKFVGKLLFALAGSWGVIALSEMFQMMAFLWIGLVLFFAVIVAGIVYMNTGKRFQK